MGSPTPPNSSYNWKQLSVLLTLAFCNFISSIVYSLQAPFYPAEAERKNLSSTQYGFVFGSYELTQFGIYPFLPLIMEIVGEFWTFQIGLSTVGIMTLLFGFVNQIQNSLAFFLVSVILKILTALGSTAVLVVNYSYASKGFPDSIGFILGIFETAYACGTAFGPPIGGLLYEIPIPDPTYKFTLPFLIVSILVLLANIPAWFIFSSSRSENKKKLRPDSKSKGWEFFKLLGIRRIQWYVIIVIAGGISVGFILGGLEPHLRQFGLTAVQTGIVFLIYGGVYAVTAPIWGHISDKVSEPQFIPLIGTIILVISFIGLGPTAFVPIQPSLILTIVSLILYSIGIGAVQVSTLLLMLKLDEVQDQFDEISASSNVSSLWLCSIAFGTFIGPTLGGWLIEIFGFRGATFGLVLLFICQAILDTIFNFIFWNQGHKKWKLEAKEKETKLSDTQEVKITAF